MFNFKHKDIDASQPYDTRRMYHAKGLDVLVCEACGKTLGEHSMWTCPSDIVRSVQVLNKFKDVALSSHVVDNSNPAKPEIAVSVNSSKETNPKDAVGSSKAPMSTLPAGVLAECGVAMLEGALKYGKFNYRHAGVRASVHYDATMRHIVSWYEGEDIDPGSGMSHITKAIVSLMVLRDAMRNNMVTDDRPPRSNVGYDDLNAVVAGLIEKYGSVNPRQYTVADTPAGSKASEERFEVRTYPIASMIKGMYDPDADEENRSL